ncbi:hypothetical protein GGD41_006561 [Paraburkholderia bryophila]|uniref:Uncharacterized protein n=1 Tax=Paraburkholderia bryophila TaxID=420952 RepID=A0A7Y9WFK5_9BURK|nr:hypothetical protein [Paraburkholderia bryophila]
MNRIVRAGLIGHAVRRDAACHAFGEHVDRIAHQTDRHRLAGLLRFVEHGERFVERLRFFIDVTRLQTEVDARLVAFHRNHREARHRSRERLRAAHAAQTAGQNPAALRVAVEMLVRHREKRLVGSLHDPLAADVDPAARRHLAVHHQALAVEFVEVFPRRPMRHQIRIRQQHARRVGMRAEHADRLARLDQQRFVLFEVFERREDLIETIPVARGPANTAVHDQRMRMLGDFRVQVVLDHPVRGFRDPGLAGLFCAARGADGTGGIETRVDVLRVVHDGPRNA